MLKTDNLLIFRDAQYSENPESAPNWNITGTSLFVRPELFPDCDIGPFENSDAVLRSAVRLYLPAQLTESRLSQAESLPWL